MMIKSKIRIYDAVYILMNIYITSKMLWDKIPYIFEMTFWFLMLWYSLGFIVNSLYTKKNSKFILYLMFMFLYILINGIFQDSLPVFARCIYEYIIYTTAMLFFTTFRSKIDLVFCLKNISVWGGFISVLTWVEYFLKHYFLYDLSGFGKISNVGNRGFRATVFSRSFLSHGVVLGVFAIISLYLWYIEKNKKYMILGVFIFLSILATGSRGPLVSIFAAIVSMYFFDVFWINKKITPKVKCVVVGIIALLLLIILMSIKVNPTNSTIEYSIYRIQSITNWNGDAGNVGRLLIWRNSINDWFIHSPIFGIGPSKTGSWGTASIGVTESGVLKRLCELGLTGFFIFYLFIIVFVKKFFDIKNVIYKKEAILWMSIFIGIFINDITVQTTEEIMIAFWFWSSLGALYYIIKKDKREGKNLSNEKDNLCNEC